MKRKPVVAWALLSEDGTRIAGSFESPDFAHVAPGERVVKLVEADPDDARVVRTTLALKRARSAVDAVCDAVTWDAYQRADVAHRNAVDRLQKKRGRK